jgi:hypothetical protein
MNRGVKDHPVDRNGHAMSMSTFSSGTAGRQVHLWYEQAAKFHPQGSCLWESRFS